MESVVPEIVNIVAGFNAACTLNIQDIASRAANAEYSPHRFNAMTLRMKEPKTTALVFSSGKIIVTGAKTTAASKLACKKFIRILQKLGYGARFLDWTVQNMVAVARVPVAIDLAMLHAHLQVQANRENIALGPKLLSCRWEPELFPAVVCKMKDPKLTLSIFRSGKIVILGCKTEQGIHQAFQDIHPVLVQFQNKA